MSAPITTPLDAATLQGAAITGTSSTLSAQSLLQQIFGPIAVDPMSALSGAGLTGSGGGTAAGSDVLGTIFSYLNMGLLTLGAIYLSYKTLVAITQTAHDGEVMGRAFHTVWVPIRVVTGVFSLMPVFGGWSLMQVVMLWFGVIGAGLGNMAWQSVATTFQPYNSLVSSTQVGSSFDSRFVPEVFKMYACVDAHNAQIAQITDKQFQPPQWGVSAPTLDWSGATPAQVINFGSNGGGGNECGTVAFAAAAAVPGNYRNNMPGAPTWLGGSAVGEIGVTTVAQRKALLTAAATQFQTLQGTLSTQAQTYVTSVANSITQPDQTTTITPYDPVAMHATAVNYQAQLVQNLSAVMQGLDMSNSIKSAMTASAQQDGFTTAGAWYTTMAAMSYAVNQLAEGTGASIRNQAQPPTSTDAIWSAAYRQINAAEGVHRSSSADTAAPGESSGSAAWKKIVSKIEGDSPGWPSGCWAAPGQCIVDWMITDNSGQPVIMRMKNIGDYTIGVAGAVMTAVGALDGAKNSFFGKVIDNVASAGAYGGAIQPWLDYTIFVCKAAIGGLIMFSIYLPLIPFIVFMGQVMNWLLSVVEGVAAAPFLAFAHLDASGEEGLGSRTHYGYTFMLQSFMRPVMLVFGFVVGSKLLEAMGGYLMQIYPMVIANVQMNSITGLISIFGFVFVFLILSVGLVNSSMSIMHILPEAIWTFMGAQTSGTVQVGRDTADQGANRAREGATAVVLGRSGIVQSTLSAARTRIEAEKEKNKISG